MTRFGYALVTLFAAELFALLFVGVALIGPRPRLIWNASASVAVGLYRVTEIEHPAVGDLIAITPPAALGRYMAGRHYLADGVPLLKHVAARGGARVCRRNDRVTIDGRLAARALDRDSRGRFLPAWRGCRIVGAQELFLLNAAPDSMDGRYFGPILATGLLGRVTPVLTRDAPGKPLHWRDVSSPDAASSPGKGHRACK